MTTDLTEEYDCSECGVHVILVIPSRNHPRICGLCIHVPGWFEYENLREMNDFTMDDWFTWGTGYERSG